MEFWNCRPAEGTIQPENVASIVNPEDQSMDYQRYFLRMLLVTALFLQLGISEADPIPVHHIEGVTLGFLVIRSQDGRALAYGEMKQVWKNASYPVMADLQFRFKDGSFYEEITKFTQRGVFRLVSDQVLQRGPAFKQDRESWIDGTSGTVTIRSTEKGVNHEITTRLNLPADVSNGLLFTLVKNISAVAGATLSMVAISSKPRLVQLHIHPAEGKTFTIGPAKYQSQLYVIEIKVLGVTGRIAPLVGKQPPAIHLWVAKSEAPTFLEFEGPLYEDGPVWRIELAAPEPNTSK